MRSGDSNKLSGVYGVRLGASNKLSGAYGVRLGTSNRLSGAHGVRFGASNRLSGAHSGDRGHYGYDSYLSDNNSLTLRLRSSSTEAL